MTARMAVLGILFVAAGCASYSEPTSIVTRFDRVNGGTIVPTASLVPVERGFCVSDRTPKDAFEVTGSPTSAVYVDPNFVVDEVVVAYVTADSEGDPAIAVQFTEDGAKKLERITSGNLGRALNVFVDGQLIASTKINAVISNGMAVIKGTFTEEQAEAIANTISQW